MISLKRELFARVTEQTGVLEKCRSGAMGRVYRSTVGVTGRVLLARGDATFLLLCGQGVVHVYMTVDAQSGRLREPHRIVARPPRFLFSWKVGGSRVKAFYCSRGREVKGSTLGGEAGFLLLHEDGSATLGMALLGGTVEAEGVQWEKRIKEPCRELETEGLRRSEVEVTAAAISAACRQYAFACRAGVAWVSSLSLPAVSDAPQNLPPRKLRSGAGPVPMAPYPAWRSVGYRHHHGRHHV